MNYRILSLDGGGTWALIQLKALIALYGEDTSGHVVLSDFDLVAANSGGSIVLGGLVEDLALKQILGFFQDNAMRTLLFSPTRSFGSKILRALTRGKVGPKYSAENKLPGLENVFPSRGKLPLGCAAAGLGRGGNIHLLITALEQTKKHTKFFRSSPASGPAWGFGSEADVTLAQAIHASTNAPVNFFDAPATFPGRWGSYWDGAISGFNNPILAAVTEAIVKGQNATDLAVLSIGTASFALPWPEEGLPNSSKIQRVVKQKFMADLSDLATSILDEPPYVATFLAHVMTGSGIGLGKPPSDSRIIRMNPVISPVLNAGVWNLPGSMRPDQFLYLAGIAMDALKQKEVNAISSYADLWVQGVAPNQPIRENRDKLAAELGQTTFPDAVAAWNAIK
jgi:hypothetical protein